MLRIEHHPSGPRLYVRGRRLHHGLTGSVLLLAGAAAHLRTLALVGALLVADDFHDFPWRLHERALP